MLTAELTKTEGAAASPKRRYLIFRLGEQEFAVDVREVREIVALMPVTRVPGVSSYIRGVGNLRGQIIPVMDLRLRLGVSPVPVRCERCVVVVADGCKLMGLAVDLVQEVVDMAPSEIEGLPNLGSEAFFEFLSGIDRCTNRERFVLEAVRLFQRGEEREDPS